jgi:zinc transport system substrate-binding protein
VIKFRYLAALLILGLLCSLGLACSQEAKTSAPVHTGNKPIVAVSVVPEQGFIEAIAKDLVEVVVMIPPGYNPENYAPTPQEMAQLSKASLYFAIGVPTEKANILPYLKDLNPGIKVVDLAEEVAAVYPDLYFAPGERDPHIWLSPSRAQVIVDTMADELALLDPNNADYYRSNAESYGEQLLLLDRSIKATLANLKQRTFIVYHPALGYFAEDYNLNMLAIEEEGKEATAKHIQEIINQAKKENIKAIFYQSSVSSKQAEVIADNIGGYTEPIDPLAADYIDNMQKMAHTIARELQ